MTVRPYRSAGGPALDVRMADAKILDMPMEFGLELMTIIRREFADAEGELFQRRGQQS